MGKRHTYIFLFLLIAVSLKIFDATIAQTGILKNLIYGASLIFILMSLPFLFKKKGGFILPVQLISISIVISIFMAQYTWGQPLSYAGTTIPYLLWFTFFYLINQNISIQKIENVVLVFGALYTVLFLFQYTHNGVLYFGFRELVEDRGVIRIIFPGGGVFFLSIFIAINKVTVTKKKAKFLWLSLAAIGMVIVVLQVTRQMIAVVVLMYAIHFFRNANAIQKLGIVIFFSSICYFFANSDNPITKGLKEQQKQDASAGKDYIRLLAAEYFLKEFTPNIASKVLGNGYYNETSEYGKKIVAVSELYGFFLSDVGLVETYVLFGIFALFGYLIIFSKILFFKLPRHLQYLQYYMVMMILTSVTSDFLISTSYLISTILVLTIYQKLFEKPLHLQQTKSKSPHNVRNSKADQKVLLLQS